MHVYECYHSGCRSRRTNGNGSQQTVPFCCKGKPIIVHTLERFQKCGAVDEIIVAVQASSQQHVESLIGEFHLSKATKIVEGGRRRQDSVSNALSQLHSQTEIVIVHDAVRPFMQQKVILDSIEKAKAYSAAVVAVRIKDTVKVGSDEGRFERTLDRSVLWSAQTPQTFRKQVLIDAYKKAGRERSKRLMMPRWSS